VTVALAAPPRCEGCSGACLWYRVPPSASLTIGATAAIPVGAAVMVTLPERYLLLGALLVYGLPLGALLTGSAVGAAVAQTDLAAAAGAAAGLLGALLAAAPLRRRLERATLRRLGVRLVP
jgi:positive regulator of sigma E activity